MRNMTMLSSMASQILQDNLICIGTKGAGKTSVIQSITKVAEGLGRKINSIDDDWAALKNVEGFIAESRSEGIPFIIAVHTLRHLDEVMGKDEIDKLLKQSGKLVLRIAGLDDVVRLKAAFGYIEKDGYRTHPVLSDSMLCFPDLAGCLQLPSSSQMILINVD